MATLIIGADALSFVEILKQFVLPNDVFVSKRFASLSVPVINLFSRGIILQITKSPVSLPIFLPIFPHQTLEIQKRDFERPRIKLSQYIFQFNRAQVQESWIKCQASCPSPQRWSASPPSPLAAR